MRQRVHNGSSLMIPKASDGVWGAEQNLFGGATGVQVCVDLSREGVGVGVVGMILGNMLCHYGYDPPQSVKALT